jgi:hypothetical protein
MWGKAGGIAIAINMEKGSNWQAKAPHIRQGCAKISFDTEVSPFGDNGKMWLRCLQSVAVMVLCIVI